MENLRADHTRKPISLLGIDTCGPSGSVALARLSDDGLTMLTERELEGRSYSATLVAAIGELLSVEQLKFSEIAGIVVTSGPGSFTGVRVGLSAAKGFAEGANLPVIAVSRLEVLAHKAGLENAALDAHRHEIFLKLGGRELLAGGPELATIADSPGTIAVCDDAAATLLANARPATQLIRVAAPTAADAIRLAIPRFHAHQFADIALLDGHYIRRSDAEIFGEPGASK